MSWFDAAGIANFAKSALNTAQKTIDKALDIKEQANTKCDEKSSKKSEADSFFEAFGLSEKPSPSSHSPETQEQNVISPVNAAEQKEASGFWTDTWGSIFEMKGPASVTGDSEITNEAEDTKSDNDQLRKDAVLSQPHSSSLFPKESEVVNPLKTVGKDDAKEIDDLSSITELSSSNDQSVKDAVLSQPHSESLFPKESESPLLLKTDINTIVQEPRDNSSTIVESVAKEQLKSNIESELINLDSSEGDIKSIEVAWQPVSYAEQHSNNVIFASDSLPTNDIKEIGDEHNNNETPGDNKPHESVEDTCIITEDTLIVTDVGKPVISTMDQSEFFNIEMPEVSKNTDVSMETSSFTHLENAAEPKAFIVIDCQSAKNTFDLPPVSENVSNWECSIPKSSNLTILDESHKVVVSSPECSYHTVDPISFTNSELWSESKESSHSNYKSQHFIAEDQIVHHVDGCSTSYKDDDADTSEHKDYDTKSSCSSGSHTTSSSFVKCSMEENDSNSHRGQSPVSTTASDKSDATKHESEQNLSGDEVETATSSDIEILSPSNGENGERNASPLKQGWLQRTPRFRRSESPTSDSSKEGVMPVVSELEEGRDHESDKQFVDHETFDQVFKKQTELQNILEAREKKLVELSKENLELQENEDRLKKLIQKMRIDQEKESKDVSTLTREFTQKLSKVENQLKTAVKERDSFLFQLEETKDEVSKRVCAADVENALLEKDIKIKELLEEGHKLSKKELLLSTAVKKLRTAKEDLEQTVQSHEQKLEENSIEVDRLRKSISAKEEQEKKHIDAIREYKKSTSDLEKEVLLFKSNHEDSLEKEKSLKTSLDSTYRDLTELRKAYAIKEIEVQELKSGLELEAKENLQLTLEIANKEATKEREHLFSQINDLRCSISQSENEANQREKLLRDEISSLQKRLQEAEERNEDLAKNMSSATRPLIRQMENLQATFTTQTISWEKIEKNLTDRLSDAQNQIALISEKERAANERYMTYQSKVTALESHNTSLRQEKLQLSAEIESLKSKIIMLEENVSRENYTIEKMKQNNCSEITRLKQEKANIESTMATCLEQLDLEKRKVQKLEEELKIKETRALILSGSSPCPSPTGSVRSSVSSIHNWSQDEPHDLDTRTPVNYRMSVYESLRLGSGSSILENLQSQLKQREGEIQQLQSEISKLELVKESMTRELVALTEQNEELDKNLNKLETIEKDHKDLNQKYNTLLQMYGEKVEETEELQLDLADVKTMYKAQIEELLSKK